MRLSAKVDYATRVMVELASLDPDEFVRTEDLAAAQNIPVPFLVDIMGTLRSRRLVRSLRGRSGGYRLAQPADQITIADVMRCVDGTLIAIGPDGLGELTYTGVAEPLIDVWMALRAAVRSVLEQVTVADVAAGRLPVAVQQLADDYRGQQSSRTYAG